MRSATTGYVRWPATGRGASAKQRLSALRDVPEPPGRGIFHRRGEVAGEHATAPRDRRLEDLLEWHRFAERIPLPRLAAQCHQRVALLVELDAFGHGIESERLGEREDR